MLHSTKQETEKTMNKFSSHYTKKYDKKKDGKETDKSKNNCIFCDGIHEHNRSKCPAYGKTCAKCKKSTVTNIDRNDFPPLLTKPLAILASPPLEHENKSANKRGLSSLPTRNE